jgi:hypothetical protein
MTVNCRRPRSGRSESFGKALLDIYARQRAIISL